MPTPHYLTLHTTPHTTPHHTLHQITLHCIPPHSPTLPQHDRIEDVLATKRELVRQKRSVRVSFDDEEEARCVSMCVWCVYVCAYINSESNYDTTLHHTTHHTESVKKRKISPSEACVVVPRLLSWYIYSQCTNRTQHSTPPKCWQGCLILTPMCSTCALR
jgi:hypothetical protein